MTTAEKKKKIKKINKMTIFALVMSFVLIYAMPFTFADDNEFQLAMAKQVLTGVFGVIQGTLTGTGNYASFYNYMIGTGTGFETTFASAYNVIKILGAMWSIAIMMSHIFTNIERGQDVQETVLKAFMELCVTGIFIMNLDAIMSWIVQFGNFILSLVTGLVPMSDDSAITSMAEDLLLKLTGAKTGGMLWGLKAILLLFFPWVCSLIMEVVAKFVVIQILIEIGLRRALAPLAVADIYQEGLRSPGVRYLKRYLAVFLKMVICLLVCLLGNQLMSLTNAGSMSDAASCIEYIFEVIAIEFSCIGVMFKTSEYANDIVGVFP